MALDAKVVLVTLPAAARPKALLSPVTGLVRGVLVTTNQNLSLGEVHGTIASLVFSFRWRKDDRWLKMRFRYENIRGGGHHEIKSRPQHISQICYLLQASCYSALTPLRQSLSFACGLQLSFLISPRIVAILQFQIL